MASPRTIDVAPPERRSPSELDASKGLLRTRLRFYAGVLCLLTALFYVLANLLRFLGPDQTWLSWLTAPRNLAHLAAVAVLGGIWGLASREDLSQTSIQRLDAWGTVLLSGCFALVGLTEDGASGDSQALLAVTNSLMARAILVPSRAFRTFWIGLCSCIPIAAAFRVIYWRSQVASTLYISPSFAASVAAIWCLVAIVLSTLTSGTIYGLERQVREARKLGPYTLGERIGSGGMGEVYKASHAMLRRPTAVKLLRADLAGEQAIARFEREVQMTSRLSHPNTIAIYDYGRTPDGVFYYAMEYLPGINLHELVVRHGPQSPGRTVHILRQVLASLAEAHAVGLVHRDVKAANVILCERGGVHDVVKVLDFGLVKVVGGEGDPAASTAGTVTGTPYYLSPEAVRSSDGVDARSDIYSVGALGYFLLTGKHPFEAASIVEVLSHHLHTEPQPPSLRTPVSVPADLETLILKCLAKNADRRPKDAPSLIRALDACSCAREWTDELARAWWAGHAAASPGAVSTAATTESIAPAVVTATSTSPSRGP